MGGVASSLKNIPFRVSLYLLINLCGLFNYLYWPLWPFPGIVVWLVRTMGVMEGWFSSQYLETHRIATLWRNSSWLENFQCVKGMLGLAFERSSQINKSMGLNIGQILKKVSLVKETIPTKRRETHLNQKHMVKFIDILDFSFYHFEDGELKTRQIPKEFPLRCRGFRVKTSLWLIGPSFP